MSLQPLFRRFHEIIQLRQEDQSAELRQKRDNILARLREKLPRTFEFFNQGSYAMGTGIKPLTGDYDLDIGIVFTLDHRTEDPHTVKGWVYQALVGYTQDVRWHNPCITVNYTREREIKYHVDLAIMVRDSRGALRLALCKQHAQADLRIWQPDGRQEFIEAVKNKFQGEDNFQLRRVIRYLKRWKDVHFPHEGRSAPTGLSLTVAALQWFRPVKRTTHKGVDYDDLEATTALVRMMQQGFRGVWSAQQGRSVSRLVLTFPYEPHDDVLAKMSAQQMEEVQGRLVKLLNWLEDARNTQGTTPLQRAFGDQFPGS